MKTKFSVVFSLIAILCVTGLKSSKTSLAALLSLNIEALTYDYEYKIDSDGTHIVVIEMGRMASEAEKDKNKDRFGVINMIRYPNKSDDWFTDLFYNMTLLQWDEIERCGPDYWYGYGNGNQCFAWDGNYGYYNHRP